MQTTSSDYTPSAGVAPAARPGPRVDLDYAPRLRAERLITTGRVLLAAFSLLAVWLDRATATRYVQLTYLLLAAYVIYAVVLAAIVWSSRASSTHFGLATHVADLVLFCLFVYLTEGPGSPFFSYFIFSMVGATLRWQWRGAIWTAVTLLVVFNAIELYAAEIGRHPEFDLDRSIIRCGYLVVLTSLLALLGAEEQRRRNEMWKLTGWPRVLPHDPTLALRSILQSAAWIVGSPRAFIAWEETDEPWIHVAAWCGGDELLRSREAPEIYDPLVAETLTGVSFLSREADKAGAAVLRASPAGPVYWRGTPIHPALVARFGITAALSVCVRGEQVDGRLFFLDKPRLTADDLVLGELVARHVSESLDHVLLSGRLRQAAATEERIRLSRDLHDGVLQSLTGAALNLETVQRLLHHEPQAASGRLAEIQRLIADEQRNLRLFIRDSKLDPLNARAGDPSLDARLRDLGERIEDVWDVRVALELGRLTGTAELLAYDIYHIVQEGLINAARHAGASNVQVTAGAHGDRVNIVVADNGRGFPFHGHFDHEALTMLRLGPVILKQRVESLAGRLNIHSSSAGARLEIQLPCPDVAI